MAETRTSYDEIPYWSKPFPQTRPERLAAVARLFGMTPPPVDNCRVLEMGCSTGGNLIAMAQDHPGSRFVGIDASSRQISDGWTVINVLGLRNIELYHLDIRDIGEELGEFDYIISHGVYSWVPAAVQNKMLETCRRNLRRNGVAYISYNTYPGWHIRGIVRDMMHFHGTQFPDPATRLAQAKALVEFVATSAVGQDTPYKRMLQNELEIIANADSFYLHHEHLEENNQPVYFHEFARRLGVNGLQYLGEAEFSTMVSTNFGPQVAETLHRLGANNIVQMEQYMDYVRCRFFRQSLICHRGIPLNRQIDPVVVKELLLSSSVAPVQPDPSLDSSVTVEFQKPSGHLIHCRHPLTKLALLTLRDQWPAPIPYPELFARSMAEASRRGIRITDENAEYLLAGEMLTGMAVGVVDWHLAPVPLLNVPDERPRVTPLARFQASEGWSVTNLLGEAVYLDEIHRQVLRHLDGTRGRRELIENLLTFIREGGHTLHRDPDKTPVTDEKEMRELLGSALDKALQNLAKWALLVRQDGKTAG
jgi:methyltransferase-like protein/SAM-dependent methyltransferase